MDDKLLRFFDRIEFSSELYSFFNGAKVRQVVVNNKSKSLGIEIDIDRIIPVNVYDMLVYNSKNLKGVDGIYYRFHVKEDSELLKEYFLYFFNKAAIECPTLASLLDNKVEVIDKNIVVDVINRMENDRLVSVSKELISKLESVGFSSISITPKYNEEKRKEVKELIKSSESKVEIKKESEQRVILGNPIKGKVMSIRDIIAEENNVVLEVYVFDAEFRETRNGGNIVTFKVSDNSDSIIAKMFTKDKDVVKNLQSKVKVNDWYRIRGYVKHDDYLRDLVLNIRDIETIKSKRVVRVDNAEEKRVELHLHTKMSQMDGLIDYGKPLFKKP